MRSRESGRNLPPYKTDGSGIFVLIVFGVVAAGVAYWAVTAGVFPALGLAGPILRAVTLTPAALGSIVLNALFGVVLGLGLGWLRLVLTRRRETMEAIVDAVARREVVSAASIGGWFVALHVIVGLAAGVLSGLLGEMLPFQALGEGHTSGPASYFYALAGSGGGSGGSGGPASFAGIHVFLAIAILVLVGTVVYAAIVAVGLGAFAHAATEEAAQTLGKTAGVTLFIALSRLRGERWQVPRRPQHRLEPTADPLVFEQELQRFVDAGGSASTHDERRRWLDGYLAWLSARGLSRGIESAQANAADYDKETRDPRSLSALGVELAARLRDEADRRKPPGSRPDTRAFWEFLLEANWRRRVLAEGVVTGLVTAAMTIVATAVGHAIAGRG